MSIEENDSIRNRRKNGTPLHLQGQEFIRQPDRPIWAYHVRILKATEAINGIIPFFLSDSFY